MNFNSIDVNTSADTNLMEEIHKLRKEKNAIILAHFYQEDDIQDIADFVGDSLGLAQNAANTDADIILMAGVHFMAETAKILSPEKKVLIPDLEAGCSLADSCPPEAFEKFLENYPDHTVITYVNTSVEIKALSDITCTSTNARQIIESLDENEKIVFGPDRNLGNYLNSVTGRNMVLWDGACHVHEQFSLEKMLDLKKEYPKAKILAHPECKKPVLMVADHIGSTSALLKYTKETDFNEFIVATESGIIHQMKLANPQKKFIPAPPNDATCACNNCNFMRLNTIRKIYLALKNERPEVTIPEPIRIKAKRSIDRMLELSEVLKY